MNIVYLLTNTSKLEGRRYYIGSKQECQIGQIDGVATIIDRTGKPYYSSSSCIEFRGDIFKGDVFVATTLEEVPDKKQLLAIENAWIDKANAVYSNEYYNISNAVLNCHDQEHVANLYGETTWELAKNNSAASKRDNSAKDLGYTNFGELCFDIWERYIEQGTWQAVSASYGKERHWSSVVVKDYDMEKAKLDMNKATQEDVRTLISKKCSLKKAAEVLGIEIPAARVLLGDFDKKSKSSFGVAKARGLSQGELEAIITKDAILGVGWRDIAKKHAVNETTAVRYFMRCIRRHLDPDDISDVIYETQEELDEARKKRKIKQTRINEFKEGLKNNKDIPISFAIQNANKLSAEGVHERFDTNGKKWVALWLNVEGKERRKGFSVYQHGEEVAFKMACEYRAKMIKEVARLKETK